MPQIYIAISIVVLAVIALVLMVKGRCRTKPRASPLASLAFGFVIMGIAFADSRFMGYSLLGVGVCLAIVDILKKLKST